MQILVCIVLNHDSFIELNGENRNTRMSDPKEQIQSRNIQLDNIFDEVNELKGIFKDYICIDLIGQMLKL
jgi:hypothetical protein